LLEGTIPTIEILVSTGIAKKVKELKKAKPSMDKTAPELLQRSRTLVAKWKQSIVDQPKQKAAEAEAARKVGTVTLRQYFATFDHTHTICSNLTPITPSARQGSATR
jgi:hypothetical protein